ncbi:MAG: hypothetical protein BIFFINMI_02558 [Phycisphaerae bacterium]|nr:hypothetical protein [Phycisphaerae bacterium]
MSRAVIAFVLFAIQPALASAAGATTQPAQPQAGQVFIERASLTLAGGEKIDYETGVLWAPENRADPASRLIAIGFARFRGTAPDGTPPTFHLPGGPGGSFLAGLSAAAPYLLRFRSAGDVVVMDLRGARPRGEVLRYGFRTPDEPLDQPGSLKVSTEAFVKISREAAAHFAGGRIDLRGYTVKEAAEDVNDLRKALGYEKISLVGISFGSQWSFATMRLHPEIVARAMLSGVEPLNDGYDMPTYVLAAMQRCWRAAEQDKALRPYIPAGGLEAAADAVIRRFQAGSAKVELKDADSGRAATVTLGAEDLQRDFVHHAPDGPAFLLSLYYEHYDAWAASVLARRRSRQAQLRLVGPLVDTSLGVTPQRLALLRSDPATRYLGQWNWDSYVASADVWPTADVGDDFRTPVRTDIPVLFAQGDWDTQTPVENTLDIARHFPNGRVLIAERGGHGVFDPIARNQPATWERMLGFLRTGHMPELPARIVLPAPRFVVPGFPPPPAK